MLVRGKVEIVGATKAFPGLALADICRVSLERQAFCLMLGTLRHTERILSRRER